MTKVVNELVDSVGVEEIMPSLSSRPPSLQESSAEASPGAGLLCAGSGVHGTRRPKQASNTAHTLGACRPEWGRGE